MTVTHYFHEPRSLVRHHTMDDAVAMIQTEPNSVGGRIRMARKSRHLTQARLAEYVGLDQSSIALFERNTIRPKHENIAQIAEALGVAPEWIDYGVGSGRRLVEVVGDVVGDAIMQPRTEPYDLVEGPPEAEPEKLEAALVRTNDHAPELRAGDVIFFRDTDDSVVDCIDDLCVITLADGSRMLRRPQHGRQRGRWRLVGGTMAPIDDAVVASCRRIAWVRKARSSPIE